MRTSLSPAQIARWPGKSNPGAPPHPAFWHMLDVGAVATQLISARSLSADPERDVACAVLIALNDIGKVSASFRAMLTEDIPQPARHWRLSHVHRCKGALGAFLHAGSQESRLMRVPGCP